MDTPNSSLQSVLGNQDPFSQAGSAMAGNEMFQMPGQQQAQAAAPTPSLSSSMEPASQLDFASLSKSLGINTTGLNQDSSLGWLQLQSRMREKLGSNYQARPEFQQLMQAWSTHSSPGSDKQLQGMQSRADRTLGALMGAPDAK